MCGCLYLCVLFFEVSTDVIYLQLFLLVLSWQSLLMDLQLLHFLSNMPRKPHSPVLCSPAHLCGSLSVEVKEHRRSNLFKKSKQNFVNSRGSYSKQRLCWPGYVLLLGRSRSRPVMIMWNNRMSIDIITAEHVSLIAASGCVSCLKYTKLLLLWPLGRHIGNWDVVSNYPKR